MGRPLKGLLTAASLDTAIGLSTSISCGYNQNVRSHSDTEPGLHVSGLLLNGTPKCSRIIPSRLIRTPELKDDEEFVFISRGTKVFVTFQFSSS